MIKRLISISIILSFLLILAIFLGLAVGSSDSGLTKTYHALFYPDQEPTLSMIIWKIRFPRVLMAMVAGAVLSVGGVVFQSILRNPLAEPYILGISGGSAIGAILGILLGLSQFPGVSLTAFTGSILTLLLILGLSSGQTVLGKDRLLLSGVMVNAFCGAVIMFLVSMTHDSRLHNIIFWLMGDLSSVSASQVGILLGIEIPCFILIFALSHSMNLLSIGKDMAQSMGVRIRIVTMTLLVVTSLMVSTVVSFCGLLGFVGLVIPHLLRLRLGPDHRILVPASILAGASYMIFCDLIARGLPEQGEMPAGVVTAMIGAPLFVFLLRRSKQ
jgi:iron complex transport system permease protein